jgi:hypothetical protein
MHFGDESDGARRLRKALKWDVLPHPRREAHAVAASRTPIPRDDRQVQRRAGVRSNGEIHSISSVTLPETADGGNSNGRSAG